MSNEERTGFRSLVYSRWHRPSSVRKLIGPLRAAALAMIDVDACEYCWRCGKPVALIETEQTDRAQPKRAPVTAALARMAQIRAYSVAYSGDIERTTCDQCGETRQAGEILLFRVRQIEPPDDWVNAMTPTAYAEFLLGLRNQHQCTTVGKAAA